MFSVSDLTRVGPVLDCRAVTFENPTGARGAGGTAANGRKGAPYAAARRRASASCSPTSTGPGTIRHIWMTFPPAPPEVMRALVLEVFYDDLDEPSISVPCRRLLRRAARPAASDVARRSPRSRRAAASTASSRCRSATASASSSRTRRAQRSTSTTRSTTRSAPTPTTPAACTRRSGARTRRRCSRDFVIEDGLRGPGRFLGCVVGVRSSTPASGTARAR